MFRKSLFVIAMSLAVAGVTACGGGEKPTETVTEKETKEESKEATEESTEESKADTDGTPISLNTPIDYTLGTMPFHSEWIQFPEPYVVEDSFSPKIAAVGDYLFVLTDKKNLGKYKRDGEKLTLENSWTLENNYEILSKGPDNTFYLSSFMSPMIQMDIDGNKLAQYEDTDAVKMRPDGSGGIITWYGSTPEKLTLSSTAAIKEAVSSLEGYKVGSAGASASHLFLFGAAGEGQSNKVFVLDNDYNVALSLGNDESMKDDTLGSVTDILETDNYYIALDGNMRNLVLWDKEGNFAGAVKDGDIFGTDYPWLCTATMADDGTMYIGLTEGREGENAKDELLIFTVSGF